MPVTSMLIMLSFVFVAGILMTIFSERLVDWITRFWTGMTKSEANDANKPYRSPSGKSTDLLSRKNEILIYRIFGIFFAIVALAVLIVALLRVL